MDLLDTALQCLNDRRNLSETDVLQELRVISIQVVELIGEIERRTTTVTGDAKDTIYLFQQLSVALQRGNAVSFQSRF